MDSRNIKFVGEHRVGSNGSRFDTRPINTEFLEQLLFHLASAKLKLLNVRYARIPR